MTRGVRVPQISVESPIFSSVFVVWTSLVAVLRHEWALAWQSPSASPKWMAVRLKLRAESGEVIPIR